MTSLPTNTLIENNTISGGKPGYGIACRMGVKTTERKNTIKNAVISSILNNNDCLAATAAPTGKVGSKVQVGLSSVFQLSSTQITIPFSSEVLDPNDEFNPLTGIFTARYARKVSIEAQLRTCCADLGSRLTLRIMRKNQILSEAPNSRAVQTTSIGDHQVIDGSVVDLAVGDTIYVTGATDHVGGYVLTPAHIKYNFLTITDI